MLRFLVPAAAAAIVAVIAMASGRLSTSAQTGPIVSVDAVSDAGNTATAVGPINTSLSTTCGATFNVDVVIQGVTNIAGFEANLLYFPTVLRVAAVNYSYLLTTTGTAVLNLGNPTPDSDGNFRMVAAMFSTTPFTGANGNGVLARITLQAVGRGSSPLHLASVKMADRNATAIPPTDAKGFYSGPVNDASIVVTSLSPCAVGGITKLADIVSAPLEAGDSSASSAGPIAAVAAAMGGALVLGGTAWYARKRWLR